MYLFLNLNKNKKIKKGVKGLTLWVNINQLYIFQQIYCTYVSICVVSVKTRSSKIDKMAEF